MTALRLLSDWLVAVWSGIGVFLRDVGHGLLEVGHNTLAVVGLTVVALLAFTAGRDDLRHAAEEVAYGWLQARQEAKAERNGDLLFALAENSAVSRATAADPRGLSRQQAAVAQWLSRRYQVAPEPLSRLVEEAWRVGQKANLEPTLILAVMAIESRFNPFAQSPVGAQGLMQVMTRVHDDKYQPFGGKHAAFDPVTNLRVGVQVLKDCIARAGSLEGGLRHYVGAAGLSDDGGYGGKVLAEQGYLQRVAAGKSVPVTAPLPVFVKADPPAAPREAAPAGTPADERVALLSR